MFNFAVWRKQSHDELDHFATWGNHTGTILLHFLKRPY